jgi:hypothetical protein
MDEIRTVSLGMAPLTVNRRADKKANYEECHQLGEQFSDCWFFRKSRRRDRWLHDYLLCLVERRWKAATRIFICPRI